MDANQDFIEFIECCNRAEVEFLLVGAHALAYHGIPRYTGDLDILIRVTPENLQRVLRALHDFGFPLQANDPTSWLRQGEVFQMGVEPNRIDILSRISGVTFEEAWQDGVPANFHGMPVRVLSRTHLVKNKQASGREKDLADVKQLNKLK